MHTIYLCTVYIAIFITLNGILIWAVAGFVLDGPKINNVDVDYQNDKTTLTVFFDGNSVSVTY